MDGCSSYSYSSIRLLHKQEKNEYFCRCMFCLLVTCCDELLLVPPSTCEPFIEFESQHLLESHVGTL